MDTAAPRRRAVSRRLVTVAFIGALLGAMVSRVEGAIALIAPTMFGVLVLMVLVRGMNRWPNDDAQRRIMWWTMMSFGAHLLFGLAVTDISHAVRYYLGTDGIGV